MKSAKYDEWIAQVRESLSSIGMKLDDWQPSWRFDFEREFQAGTDAGAAALRANRFWWHQQNKTLGQECRKDQSCWLPTGHGGACDHEEVER